MVIVRIIGLLDDLLRSSYVKANDMFPNCSLYCFVLWAKFGSNERIYEIYFDIFFCKLTYLLKVIVGCDKVLWITRLTTCFY